LQLIQIARRLLSKYTKQYISIYYIKTIIMQINNIFIKEEVDYKILNSIFYYLFCLQLYFARFLKLILQKIFLKLINY